MTDEACKETLMRGLVARFGGLEDALNRLDAAAGDGDHGSTMLRGFRAAETAVVAGSDPVAAFRATAGGASGSLFAQVLSASLAICDGAETKDAFSVAAKRIAMVGQAKPGDRTMLDALIPASEADGLEGAVTAAAEGAQATLGMSARRGRARYVEGAGRGHMDAGARSVTEILTVLLDVMEGEPG